MTRTTSIKRLAALAVLASLEIALRVLGRITDRNQATPDDDWQREPAREDWI